MKRISIVKGIHINAMLFSATLQVGDNLIIAPSSRVFAVQREFPAFIGNEGNLNSYPTFTRPIPMPIVSERIQLSVRNVNPFIHVDSLKIIGASTASVIQIGSNQIIHSENRTKHIRQLIARRNQQ
jgi:spore germination protein PE